MISKWFYILKLSIYRNPIFGLVFFLINYFYSWFISVRLIGLCFYPIVYFSNGLFLVEINKARNARVKFKPGALLEFGRFANKKNTRIRLEKNSTLIINGNFSLGEDCFMSLAPNSLLIIEGGNHRSGSGVTSETKILCHSKITIGAGTIIAWNVYISDSNQHKINGVLKCFEVSIGKNVWVSEGVTITPGTKIGDGCIVAAKSLLRSGDYPEQVMLAGAPAKIINTDVTWEH